ncbi:MAG: hypothetical protein IT200_05265 [Thermoleophilia bacterium]|nr:hypothetical protein [Thermoleophilia bacterium]
MAAALGDAEWSSAASLIAGGPPAAAGAVPSYGELAATGMRVIELLAAADRWAEARVQAAHLADYFTRVRREVHPVAAVGFQGLCDAAQARDGAELGEHLEFLREILGT